MARQFGAELIGGREYPYGFDIFNYLPADKLVSGFGTAEAYRVDVADDYVSLGKVEQHADARDMLEYDIFKQTEDLPLLGELFMAGDNPHDGFVIATTETVNQFGREHLEALGATTVRLVQTREEQYFAEQFTDSLNVNEFRVGADLDTFTHDIVDHSAVRLIPERSTQLVRQMTQLSAAMRAADSENSIRLARMLTAAFHEDTSFKARYRLHHVPRDQFLGYSTLMERTFAHLKLFPHILAAAEKAIDGPPGFVESEVVGAKAEAWMQWETDFMPAYSAAISEKLRQQPQGERQRRISALLADVVDIV